MDNRDTAQYIIAEGPDGLRHALDELLLKLERDPSVAAKIQTILYQLGNQTSLIKVDLNQTPFHFWYIDLLGRPATKIVKETIAQFLWEQCGEKERYLHELAGG